MVMQRLTHSGRGISISTLLIAGDYDKTRLGQVSGVRSIKTNLQRYGLFFDENIVLRRGVTQQEKVSFHISFDERKFRVFIFKHAQPVNEVKNSNDTEKEEAEIIISIA